MALLHYRAVRCLRLLAALAGCVTLIGLSAEAQQIYRWTDEQGKAHFSNSPPPNAKDVQTNDRAQSQAELDCEAAARRQCRRDMKTLDDVFDDVPTTLIRDCMEEYTRNCANFSKPKPRGTPSQHTLVTPRVRFDQATGDHLVC